MGTELINVQRAAEGVVTTTAVTPDTGVRPRILIVDDDETLLRSLARVLHPHYDVQCESNPYRALVAIEDDGPFAAVVSDLTMPGLDGIALLETCYAQAPDSSRILLTGNATVDASVDAVNRAHVTNLLVKPVSSETLLRTLRDAVLLHTDLADALDAEPTPRDEAVVGDPAIDLTGDRTRER